MTPPYLSEGLDPPLLYYKKFQFSSMGNGLICSSYHFVFCMDWNANNTQSAMELKSFPKAKDAKKLVKYPQNQDFLWSLYRKY